MPFIKNNNATKAYLMTAKHGGTEIIVTGNNTFTPTKTGSHLIVLVGGGAGGGAFDAMYYGGWSEWLCAAGGSGAYFKGFVNFIAGEEYSVSVGSGGNAVSPNGTSGAGGNTILYKGSNPIITAGGGGGCQNAAKVGSQGAGQGGTVTIHQPDYITETIINQTGSTGGYGAGNCYSPSVYDGGNFGIGAGGDAWADGDDNAWAHDGKKGLAIVSYGRDINKYFMLVNKKENTKYYG